MSARGRLPTSNTFELIRKWKLVKEEEEEQQQKVKLCAMMTSLGGEGLSYDSAVS